jgi:hypothetical protein
MWFIDVSRWLMPSSSSQMTQCHLNLKTRFQHLKTRFHCHSVFVVHCIVHKRYNIRIHQAKSDAQFGAVGLGITLSPFYSYNLTKVAKSCKCKPASLARVVGLGITLLDATRRYSTLFDATQRYSTLFDAVRRCSTLFDAFRRCSTLFDAVRRCSTLFDAFRRCSTLFNATQRC